MINKKVVESMTQCTYLCDDGYAVLQLVLLLIISAKTKNQS